MHSVSMTPQTRPAPKVGLLLNSIDVFNPEAKDRSEQSIRDYFDGLVRAGTIHPDSVIRGRIFGPHEAAAAADEFAELRVDLVVVANVAFPNGHVFLRLATHPNLVRTPIAVIADPEPASVEWATNAWCGVIMNNHVARRIGRYIEPIVGPVDSPEFRIQFERLLRVAGTIKFLRSDFLCRFGDAPSGFHSATGDQLAFAATFGTRVDTMDLTQVMDVYRTGIANGYLGVSSFDDEDVRATLDEMARGCEVSVEMDAVERGVRLYHAFRAIVRANGYTSAAVRCWPEFHSDFIGITTCMAMGMLMGRGDLAAVACESDWPTAVAQSIGTMLSGRPAACLDWVNDTGGSEVVQLGHCGVGMPGQMAEKCCTGLCDALAVHPVLRQGGTQLGPVHIGQYSYGPKTGICLTQDADGSVVVLGFTGESSPESARNMLYSATDVRVPDYKRLNRLVLDYGFPHHLAVAMDDITEDLRMLCAYLDVDYVSPHDG
jgi:L-fucose isomerase-like protein